MSNLVYKQISLVVGNVFAGQVIQVDLASMDAPVGWSTGAEFAGASELGVRSLSGYVPLDSLRISASQVQIRLAHGYDGGGATTIEVVLYLVAEANIQTFSLRSSSDPSVSVRASLGFSQPMNVNQNPTLFSWQ